MKFAVKCLSSVLLLVVAGLWLSTGRAQGITILAMGDSTTVGYLLGNPGVDAYPAQLQTKLRTWNPGKTITVINSGVNGETSTAGLGRLNTQLATHAPDYVVIQYSANDSSYPAGSSVSQVSVADYTSNLNAMVDAVLAVDAVPVLMSSVPFNSALPVQNPRWPYTTLGVGQFDSLQKPYVAAMASVASTRGVVYVDVNGAFQTIIDASYPSTMPPFYLDYIHPNAQGYGMEVDLLAPALQAMISPAPEPGTLAMLMSGGVMLWAVGRKRC